MTTATSANVVPLPYSRVAVQHVDFELDPAKMAGFLRGKEAWFETDFVVFRRGQACAVAEVRKGERKGLFCSVADVDVVSLPETSRWIDDFTVDTGNPSALAEKARATGVTDTETLVVNGLYEHVNFIHWPRPVVVDVFDLSPPEPPRLLDMARRVLASRRFPAIVLNAHIKLIREIARPVAGNPVLFPCAVSQLKEIPGAFYLDERPPRQDWVLVGCERSRQVHRHVYGDDPPRIDLCPKALFAPEGSLNLMRCCMVENEFRIAGNIATVPWGADLSLVEEALHALLELTSRASLRP